MSLALPETILFDGKETKFESIVVTLEMLAKIRRQAKDAGRHQPCIVLGFLTAKPPIPSEWAVIPLDFLENLWTAATGKKNLSGLKKIQRRKR